MVASPTRSMCAFHELHSHCLPPSVAQAFGDERSCATIEVRSIGNRARVVCVGGHTVPPGTGWP